MIFESDLFRFATSGTLIGLYAVVDHVARRSGSDPLRARTRAPRWMAPIAFCSVLAFYLTIRPYGGAWAGGAGNLAGILVALAAMTLRWRTRGGIAALRQPDVAARVLFYAALPAAVGSALGWLALTLPALAMSAWWCAREDAMLVSLHGETWRRRMETSSRWLPGIW